MVNLEHEHLTFYMEIDTLFDVKYRLIEKYYPHLAKLIWEDGSYILRHSDNIEHKDSRIKISGTLMEILFKDRNKKDLSLARPTSIPVVIGSILNDVMNTSQNGEDLKDLKFIINMYPYKLTENEQYNIARFVGQFFKKYTEYEIVNLKPEEVTSTWIQEKDIDFMCMYNFLSWLELSTKRELFKTVVDHVRVITPKLMNLQTTSTFTVNNLENMPWDAIENCCKMFMDLEFMDASYFSPLEMVQEYKEKTSG